MKIPYPLPRVACLRLAPLLGLLALFPAPALRADPLNADLSAYTAQSGLTAAVSHDVLTVTWQGAGNTELRARYALDQGRPMVRELAVRRGHGHWAVLGQDLTPQFDVQTGHRRIDFAGLAPLRLLGVDVTSKAVVEEQAWVSFWDAPFVIPSDPKRTPGPLRAATEVQRATGTFTTSSCTVKTDGARVEVSFPGLSMGIFSGGIRFTAYRGTNLLRVEAIAQTQKNLVAYKYAVGLKGISTAILPHTRWLDTGGNPQEYQFGGAIHDSPVTVRAKNRVIVAEGAAGSIAVFPPPTVFFPAREVDTNLGYVWFRKDAAGQYSIGVKQADHEDDPRFLQNFAVYNAPPGTMQRMAAYFYLTPDDAATTRAAVMAFTHNDTFAPIPGYKTMVNHFHLRFTDHLRASGSLDTQTPDLAAMKALGINLVGLSDFHDDQLAQNDPGPKRFADQHDYIEGTRRASDTDFLVLPWEEPSTYFGGHTNLVNARPIYFSKVRRAGQPFTEQDPKYGTVYHLGSTGDAQRMMDATNSYWYTAHPRTKSSAGYPDAYWDKPFAKNDRYLGVAFKPGMGMDLSEQRLADWRVFGSIDTMNNMYADTDLQPKLVIGDCDTYQKWPHDDLFPGFPVNYLKLNQVPGPDDDWSSILTVLRKGDFFVTTGEILIRNYAVEGTGSQRKIVADVDWTYPLEFVEVVWGDGKTIDRQIIRATNLGAMTSKHFEIPFDATGKKWVRFAVWDSAVNGAFVQPVWLQR
jgi:hypothetical protein